MNDGSPASKPGSPSSSKQVVVLEQESSGAPVGTRKGIRFWLVFLAICVSLFLSALELTAVSSALPTIIHALEGDDFVWVGSAYALASTALLPATGGMAQIFGRRPTMLLALAMFALGSALCGSARNMNWLIAGRTVQGAGGGGLLAVTSIIISDLVPLRERATYNGLIGMTWGVASAMGPVVGGSLAQRGQWRWLFYLNLPLTGLAAILVLAFLKLRTPSGSFTEKFARMDWIGNALVVSSTSATIIGLTWGGVKFPWSSAHVLVPLILGICGLGVFLFYEATFAKEPMIPFTLISNRTSLSGYIQTFIGPILMIAATYFLPAYYQACKDASPTRSGVELFGLAVPIGPVLLMTGASIAITKRYRVQLWLAWCLTVVSMGVMSTLRADSPISHGIGYPIFLGIGAGIWYAATYFPVLAPLPVSENAHALAFFAFCRSFANVWGVTIGTAVFQTQLQKKLPQEFIAQLPSGVDLSFAIIPIIPTLDEPFRSEVQAAYALSISVIWQVMIGIGGIGFLASLVMKGLPLHTEVDREWGLNEEAVAISESAEMTERA